MKPDDLESLDDIKLSGMCLHADPPGSIQVIVNPYVPLTRHDPSTGAVVDVLFVRLDGALHIHPDRLAMIESALAQDGLRLLR